MTISGNIGNGTKPISFERPTQTSERSAKSQQLTNDSSKTTQAFEDAASVKSTPDAKGAAEMDPAEALRMSDSVSQQMAARNASIGDNKEEAMKLLRQAPA